MMDEGQIEPTYLDLTKKKNKRLKNDLFLNVNWNKASFF